VISDITSPQHSVTKKEYTLGINDETTGILFMKRE